MKEEKKESKYTFDLYDRSEDAFNACDDSIIEVQVESEDRKNITEGTTTYIYLSRNGLIGLGTELIRFAQEFHPGSHWHMEPSTKENMVCCLGVFTAPNSSNIILCCEEYPPIDECFEEDEE